MVLGEPLASLITFFRKRLIKLHLNSQQMSDFFYHMTESCELNLKKKRSKKQKKIIRPCFGIFGYDDVMV